MSYVQRIEEKSLVFHSLRFSFGQLMCISLSGEARTSGTVPLATVSSCHETRRQGKSRLRWCSPLRNVPNDRRWSDLRKVDYGMLLGWSF